MSSGVEFEEDKFGLPNVHIGARGGAPGLSAQGFDIPSNTPKMARWLMKKGIVKSEKTATVLLFLVIIVNIVVTFIVIKFFL